MFRPPPTIEILLLVHEILPIPVPLLKQVPAGAGDEVSRGKEPVGTIFINGKVNSEILDKDRKGGRSRRGWDA